MNQILLISSTNDLNIQATFFQRPTFIFDLLHSTCTQQTECVREDCTVLPLFNNFDGTVVERELLQRGKPVKKVTILKKITRVFMGRESL